ncbi:hypothetical protein [Paraburkholderia pallida]|uniref:Uncharacterized protein n=1 Tax=Paraburkholderia pallida TaxID=2547399 RepID=A0A4V1AZH1_9BURK|nr:hypothetical protein [Paraburkholderia pallida]QBQ99252.1 hypothetical protein E1956_18785 [Paraburkholderia pallida]
MEFPKMLYRSSERFPEPESFKRALVSGAIQTLTVNSAEEQTGAEEEGWTEDLASLSAKKRGRPRTDGTNTPED